MRHFRIRFVARDDGRWEWHANDEVSVYEESLQSPQLGRTGPCLFDDVIMKRVARNDDVALLIAEVCLRALTGNLNLTLSVARAQARFVTEGGRAMLLDIWATEHVGTLYNVEFQRDSARAGYVRAEAHQMGMQSKAFEPGMKFGDNPRSEVYFITEEDQYPEIEGPITRMYVVPGEDCPSNELPEKVSGRPVESRQIVRYVDGKYGGKGPLADLMHGL